MRTPARLFRHTVDEVHDAGLIFRVGGVIAIRATSVLLRGMINASMLGFPGGSPGSPPMGVVSPVIGGGGGGGASG